MKRVSTLVCAALVCAAPTLAMAEDKSDLSASIRIGLTAVDDGSDLDISIRNFGSRLKWSGQKDLDNGLAAIGYIELGLNPDSNGGNPRTGGVDRTRQLWAGLSGDFGEVKIGAQYASFYDMISSFTDIAYWGSCWTQFECARDTRVLKYSGSSGDFSYSASFSADPGDVDNDPADNIELGANYDVGPVVLGAAISIQADKSFIDDGGFEVESDGGTLLGFAAKGDAGAFGWAGGLQLADEDFGNTTDDATNISLAGTYGAGYAVANLGDIGERSPFFLTLGYSMDLTKGALIYYELQTIDNDFDNQDATTIGRATLKVDF